MSRWDSDRRASVGPPCSVGLVGSSLGWLAGRLEAVWAATNGIGVCSRGVRRGGATVAEISIRRLHSVQTYYKQGICGRVTDMLSSITEAQCASDL